MPHIKAMQQEISSLFGKANIHVGALTDELDALTHRYLPEGGHVVCDVNTHAALGHRLHDYPALIFPEPPAADLATVERIRAETADAPALIAVGSGTINDLVKYATFLDEKPYIVLATAPSMNGYASTNASITVNGYKKTLSARPPKAVLCDIPTLEAAPERLIQAGIGDTLCRSTVQADWLLAHLLTETEYEPHYFDWLRPWEEQLLAHSPLAGESNPAQTDLVGGQSTKHKAQSTIPPTESLRSSAPPQGGSVILSLTHALLLSGLAMRDFGSSAPASQGEHMIAHTMEMLFPDLPSRYHGEEIAVTTVTMAKWQEKLLASSAPPRISHQSPKNHLPAALLPQSRLYYQRKFPNDAYVERLNKKLAADWPHIAETISAVMLPASTLEKTLSAHGCPTRPEQIGWPQDKFAQAYKAARFTRDRFTFLDLAM